MTAVVPLGRLEAVSLRDAWPDEARNFTPWLADDANLSLLGEALGLQLEVESVEKPVGSFSADILAKEVGSGRWVLIENQIEPTDHRHLGQLLTYAAGLDAKIVIWTAESFREEHRAALDFLNRATGEEFAFFGVQVELFRIGASALAPSFSVVAKPNNWSKKAQAGKQAAEESLSPAQAVSREFWGQLIAKANGTYPALAVRTPYKGNWQTSERLFSSKQLVVESNATFPPGRLRVEVYLGGPLAKAAFFRLRKVREDIEKTFGAPLAWEELPQGQDARISFYMPGEQRRESKSSWASQSQWILHHWPKIAETFRPYFVKLDIGILEQEDISDLIG